MSKQRFEKSILEEGALSEPLSHVYMRVAALCHPERSEGSLLPSCHPGPDPGSPPLAESVLKIIMEELSGGVYIPSVKTFERLLRDRKIRQAFNGSNYSELALSFGLSLRSLRRIVCHNPSVLAHKDDCET